MTKRTILFACATLALAWSLFAQKPPQTELGFKPDKLYHYTDLDSVNLFNGNLIIRIPIGLKYPASSTFSYQLTLVYNSKVWDYKRYTVQSSGGTTEYLESIPNFRSNAGAGWRLSLGRLIPRDSGNLQFVVGEDPVVYEGATGDEHGFVDVTSNAPVSVSHDEANLRLIYRSATQRDIEFPNGQVHEFSYIGTGWRVTKIRDRQGNYLSIGYTVDADDRDTKWTLIDSLSRVHEVNFAYEPLLADGVSKGQVVSSVMMRGVANTPYYYNFSYDHPAVAYGCEDNKPGHPGSTVQLPVLGRIGLPDGTQYSFTYNAGGTSCEQGAVASMTVPAGGTTTYAYKQYLLPSQDPCVQVRVVSQSAGVTTRTLPDGGVWDYVHTLANQVPLGAAASQHPCGTPTAEVPGMTPVAELIPARRWARTSVLSPAIGGTRVRTDNFFNVWTSGSWTDDPWDDGLIYKFGSPLTTGAPDGAADKAGLYESTTLDEEHTSLPADQNTGDPSSTTDNTRLVLSTRVYDGCANNRSGACTDFRRSTLLHYEQSPFDMVVQASKTRYEDSGADCTPPGVTPLQPCYATQTYSDPNGAGYYRTMALSTNFLAGGGYSTYTAYDDWSTTVQPNKKYLGDTTIAWLPTLYSKQSRTENGVTATTLSCFDATTGFLNRQRVLTGASAGSHDVVTQYDKDTKGNVTAERTYGGDLQDVSTSDVCGQTLVSPQYVVRYGWLNGALASARYHDPVTDAAILTTADYVTDATTGLVTTARDSAGLATTYTYDALPARLTSMTNPFGGVTTYTYTTTLPLSVSITASATGLSSVNSRVDFDNMGRISREGTKLPTGEWSVRETQYDTRGRKLKVSEPVSLAVFPTSSITGYWTEYGYDTFDRETSVKTPVDSIPSVMTAWSGNWQAVRTTKVQTSAAGTSDVTRTETYDAQGRLASVAENSAPGGAVATTSYTYDVGGRLHNVTMKGTETVGGILAQQVRTFSYDNRGFLASELHPESGLVTYPQYDARGHATQKRREQGGSKYDLNFTWDKAERLTRVDERDPNLSAAPAFRVLKTFEFGTANGSYVDPYNVSHDDHRQGRLWKAVRYNYPADDDLYSDTYRVTEQYVYEVLSNTRKTHRQTTIEFSHLGSSYALVKNVLHSQEYDALDQLKTVNYPNCIGCAFATPQRSYTYSAGKLMSVPTEVTSVSYYPNGLVSQLVHANNIADSQTTDLVPRPKSITFGSWSDCKLPVISQQPASVTVTTQQPSAHLTVGYTATGTVTFQWWTLDSATGFFAPMSGQTASSLDVTPSTTSHYRVRITASCGGTGNFVDSEIATVTVNSCDAPQIIDQSGISTQVVSGTPVTLFVSAKGTGPLQYTWYRGSAGNTSTPVGTGSTYATGPVTSTATYWVRVTSNGCGSVDSQEMWLGIGPAAPQNLQATRIAGTSTIRVSWNAVPGAAQYILERRSSSTETDTVTISGVSYDDLGRTSGQTYVYRVKAIDAYGYQSLYSNRDLATIMTFTPIATYQTIQLVQLTEILAGLNAVRANAGMSALTWTDILPSDVAAPAPYGQIRAVHLTTLRTRFDDALSALGIRLINYTDRILIPTDTTIKMMHISELQGRAQ